MFASSTNKDSIIFDRQISSSFVGRLQHHHPILFVVHLELTKSDSESRTIDGVVDRPVNPQIFPRLQTLDPHLVVPFPLNLESGQITFSSVMSNTAAIRVHAE